jgi:hypothetical protein
MRIIDRLSNQEACQARCRSPEGLVMGKHNMAYGQAQRV